jgi:hypothetical protein
VSSTILMVIVLVVMWLVVLVPMFVRRHEDEAASADQPASPTRVLARRTRSTRGRGPHRHRCDDAGNDAAPGWPGVAASAFSRDQARRRMLLRRRRTLLLLLTLTALGFAGATLVTAWFWGLHICATALLAGYVAWLRKQVGREHARRLRRAALSARTAPPSFPAPLGHLRPAPQTPSARVSAARPASRAGEPTAPPHTGGRPSTSDSKLSARPGDPVVALDDDDPTLADIEPVVTPVERRRAVNG